MAPKGDHAARTHPRGANGLIVRPTAEVRPTDRGHPPCRHSSTHFRSTRDDGVLPARKTVMPVAPTNARVPMRPRVSRADAPPARVRRASAKTHAPSAKTIAAVDLARVGSGTLSSRPYVHKINNCNVCTYNVILITRLIVRPTANKP